MSTLSIDAPMGARGFVTKAGTLAAGTALAGAALFGGAAVAPTIATGLSASVQHEFALTAFPTFEASLQNLLNTLDVGTMGQALGLLGTTASPITTASELSALLANLNPGGTTLDSLTGGLLAAPLTDVVNQIQIGGVGMGTIPLDSLIGGFLPGGETESIGDLLTSLQLGPYVGLLDLPMLGLSPNDTVVSLVSELLGVDGTTATINSLLTANGVGTDTISGILGINSGLPWDQVLSGISLDGGTSTLGSETLAGLLTSLLPAGSTAVGDGTDVTAFLGDLGLFTADGGLAL